jgi:hypothetical protein
MKYLKNILFGVLIAISLSACKKSPVTPPVDPPIVTKKECNVLFVGNSFTYYNDGVDYHLQKMLRADESSDTIIYTCQKVAVGSYTLEAHYGDQATLNMIKSKKWTTVVLQEQSTRPINSPSLFLEFATKLDVEIKKQDAKTVLYMTWAPKDQPTDIVELANSYNFVGTQINALVVPVGNVWEYMRTSNPTISLYISDNKHPTLSGTYLTVCVFYYYLFDKNPVDNTYLPSGMSSDDVVTIRKAVNDYTKLKKRK